MTSCHKEQYPIHVLKVHGSKTHQKLLRVYRKNTLPFYRSVRGWLLLMRNAMLYGVEQQMIRRREPILESIMEYEPWKPETKLQKYMWDIRVQEVVDHLMDGLREREPIERAVSPFTNIVTRLADWDCIRMAGDKRIGQHHLRIYGETMKMAGQIARISTTWDVVNRHAVEWAAKNTNKLVTAITNETREALRGVISRGIAEGKSIPTIGREIRPLVGLNNVQIRTAEKLRAKLVEAGAKNIDAKVERYARKAHRYRAETISRTEVSRAMSEGTIEGYEEAGVQKIRFEASADACPVCSFLDGNVYTRAKGEGVIPQHPNCRCTWVPLMESVKKPKPEVVKPKPKKLGPIPGSGQVVRQVLITESEQVGAEQLKLAKEATKVSRKAAKASQDASEAYQNMKFAEGKLGYEAAKMAYMKKEGIVDELTREWSRIDTQIRRKSSLLRTAGRKMVANPSGPLKADIRIEGFSAARTKDFAKGREFFYNTIGPDKTLKNNPPRIVTDAGGRAHYTSARGTAVLDKTDDASVAVHELGHAFEEAHPEVMRKARMFRDDKLATSHRLRPLSEITGDAGYEASELAMVVKAPDPYCGKFYSSGQTEVISQGMGYLYQDPVKFARDWPEYFDFVIDTVRGAK